MCLQALSDRFPFALALCAGLGILSLPAVAQRNVASVLRIGNTVANGDTITGFRNLRTNDLGQWAVIVQTNNASPQADARALLSGQLLLREGQAAPGTTSQTIDELVDLDLSDDGRVALVVEATHGFIVYVDDHLVLHENDAATASGFGPNARFVDVVKVNLNANDQILLRCRVIDPAATPQNLICLVRLDLGPGGAVLSQTLYARTGDILPGVADPLQTFSAADNALSFNDSAQGTWAGRLIAGATPGIEVAYENNTTLMFQGGATASLGGRTFLDVPVEATARSMTGAAAYAALLDPSNTDNDELIVLDNNVYLREGQPFTALPGAPVIDSLGLSTLYLTDAGEVVCFVSLGAGGTLGQAFVRGNDVLLRTGDVIFGGEEIVAIGSVEHGFDVSDNGQYALALALLDSATFALLYVQEALGTSYCAAQTNSTGQRAITQAQGLSLAYTNRLRLLTTDAPAGSFGYYITSRTQGDVLFPGGSSGRICLAGSIGRFVTQVGQVSAAGTFAILPDLAVMPTNPNVAVQPGETWNFQMWFRDAGPVGATSNFSLPVSVEFH
jgi:hypothetical protein